MSDGIDDILKDTAAIIGELAGESGYIREAGERMARALSRGGAVYALGNGGSAAQSEHLAAELVGQFELDRPALRCRALTCNPSTLTAVGNDFDHGTIFVRQVKGLVTGGDAVVCLSTSGDSENVVRATKEANRRGADTIGLTGEDGGELAPLCDVAVRAPAGSAARVQEAHLVVIHLLCRHVEREMEGAE